MEMVCMHLHTPEENSKQKSLPSSLIFGKLVAWSVSNGDILLQVECCKPYNLQTMDIFVEEHAKKGTDIWYFRLEDVIGGYLKVSYQNQKVWRVHNILDIVTVFRKIRGKNRQKMMETFIRSGPQLILELTHACPYNSSNQN